MFSLSSYSLQASLPVSLPGQRGDQPVALREIQPEGQRETPDVIVMKDPDQSVMVRGIDSTSYDRMRCALIVVTVRTNMENSNEQGHLMIVPILASRMSQVVSFHRSVGLTLIVRKRHVVVCTILVPYRIVTVDDLIGRAPGNEEMDQLPPQPGKETSTVAVLSG